jgi:uncharacterized membrane protein YraQ (UPF0718 family)
MTTLVETLKHMKVPRIDGAWAIIAAILLGLAVLAPAQLPATILFALKALANTAPYILFAVLAVAYLKASGAEAIVAKAFEGRQVRMIVLAAAMGGLSPFCSCEVIPFVAGLLALGTPIAPVMAFWLASPLMDPAAFAITAGALGFQFAIAKTIIAVSMGLFGGFAMFAATQAGWFADPLKPREAKGGCCGGPSPFKGKPVWQFWTDERRRDVFYREAASNGLFLLKWLTLAYVIESLMLAYLPAETIGKFLGGNGVMPIFLSALAGAPAYLNGYAAPPLVAGLMTQGMSAGAAMAFVIAGGVSCIPAMTAVFALVKLRVFAAYVGLGFVGAVLAGMAYGLYAAG